VRSKTTSVISFATALLLASASQALPLLSTGAGDWSYDRSSRSWETQSDPFSLVASNGAVGGSAYLTVSGIARPGQDGTFDITVSNDGVALDPIAAGTLFGVSFEVYRFDFDSSVSGLLSGSGGRGFQEVLGVAIHSLGAGVKNLSFMLASRPNGLGNVLRVRPNGDAGYVPEPGAVGVFSVGLLVAGFLIQRLRQPN
jgi:hypothetical protein